MTKGMEDEHCAMYGHDVPFTTGNYDITTTPGREYRIATGALPCPEEDTKDKEGKAVRVIKRIEDLQRLPVSIDAGLLPIEILALVGPAYAPRPPCRASARAAFDRLPVCAGRCSTRGRCTRCTTRCCGSTLQTCS